MRRNFDLYVNAFNHLIGYIQGGARRGSRHGKVLGKEKWQVARRGKERIKAW